jgi:hypothetical protein
MDMYRMRGHLFIEGTMEAADYDFDMEWEEEGEPDALDALRFMLDSGIIQIMHESTEYLGDDEEDE